jgi:hypothetical protein
MLLLGDSRAPFHAAVRRLAPFRPSVVRTGELRAGPLVMRVWLVRLGRYYPLRYGTATHSALAPR